MKKRVCTLLVTVLLAFCLFGGQEVSAEKTKMPYGLTISDDGTVMMDGKPFYGYGVNGYMICMEMFKDPFFDYEEPFRTMKEYNIAFIRMPLAGDSPATFQMYLDDPEAYFAVIDKVIAMAEKYQVGIIADMSWGYCYMNALFGEQAYRVGDTSSQSYKFSVKHAEDVVKRYKDSPAIYGWEISNELNLCADLAGNPDWLPGTCYATLPAKPNGFDYYTGREVQVLMRGVAQAIRKQDGYRLISNGNGIMRGNAKSLQIQSDNMDKTTHTWTVSWEADTLEEFFEMSAFYAPDPIDTLSLHIGIADDIPPTGGNSGDTFEYWGKTITRVKYLKAYVEAAKREGKAFFVGEFGDLGTIEEFLSEDRREINKKKIRDIMDDLNAADVQLSAVWAFAFDDAGVRHIRDDGKLYSYFLEQMQYENEQFQKKGLQNVKDYWDKAVPVFHNSGSTTTTKTPITTKKVTTTTTEKSVNNTAGITTTTVAGAESAVTPGAEDVRKYMVSSSTKLTIDSDTNTIHITEERTLDVFTRSIALKSGYTLKVYTSDGLELTDSEAAVGEGATVKVFDSTQQEVRSFTVTVEAPATDEEATPEPTPPTVTPPEDAGFPAWGWIVIAVGAVAVLGGGFAVYWFVLRKQARM